MQEIYSNIAAFLSVCMLSISITANVYAEPNPLIKIYNNMLFVEGTPFKHGTGVDSWGEKQYIFPISSGMENKNITKSILYLIGTKLQDNKIHFKSFNDKSSRNRNNSVAIFKRKNGESENYHLISARNKREYDDRFYETKYVNEEEIIRIVNNLISSQFKTRYGFPLNENTLNICNNKPIEVYQEFSRGKEKIYYYSANCTRWEGASYSGKAMTALFKLDDKGEYNLYWKTTNSGVWRWAGGNPYKTRFVGDLDNDGNIEVFLQKAEGLASKIFLAELQNNKADVITEIRYDSEGERESYPTTRHDNLLFDKYDKN